MSNKIQRTQNGIAAYFTPSVDYGSEAAPFAENALEQISVKSFLGAV